MSGAPIPEIPEWFVPRHEVQRQTRPIASGSYGEVFRGIRRGSKVVTKCVSVRTSLEKKAFLREARIWHKARHPHIVNFFGACYDTHPCFFICEEASNGNLVDYLDRMKGAGPALIWSKLHEAALGLEYLHQNDIVHGDLKCNQILITGEGVAKLTDFGFSFVLSGSKPIGSGGATRWRAPECLGCNGQIQLLNRMCIRLGCAWWKLYVPWGVYLPDVALMDHLRHRRFLPRPKQFVNDIEWEFVVSLCKFQPSRRIKLGDAIKQLQRFAEGGKSAHTCLSTIPVIQGEQRLLRLSKKASLEILEETRKHRAECQVFNTVLCLTTRSQYLRFRRAVQTIQLVFRHKIRLQQNRALALPRSAAKKVSSFVEMVYQRTKFVRFVCAVQLLQCRFPYRRLKANELELKTETQPTASSLSGSHTGDGTKAATALRFDSQTRRSTEGPSTQTSRLPWINDEDRIKCCICFKDFTIFRRKHHCRVCFEIICSGCSLTRKKTRVCMVCAGLRPPVDDPELTATIRPQAHRRGRIIESTGGFLTGFGIRFRSRRGDMQTEACSLDEGGPRGTQQRQYASDQLEHVPSHNLSPRGQAGLWEGDVITAARIPRNAVTIARTISRGAFGMVHLGTWNDMQVAIKTLLPESRMNISEINQFLAEAKILATMEHHCIVNLIGIAWDSLTDICMVMEYMDGGDLRSLLHQYEEIQYPVGFDDQKLSIALNVAHAVTYLYSLTPPVLHRDLKSRNVLLNDVLEAKVTNFGVSRKIVDRTMTAGVGTGRWMAPEVLMGERYNEKSDIFSFGIVLFELDTQKMPYSQEAATMPEIKVIQRIAQGSLRVKFSKETPQSIVELGNSCISWIHAERPSAAEAMYKLQCASQELS